MNLSDRLLEKIAEEVRVCQDCDLWRGRTNAVPGEGRHGARVMLIGEAPGRQEDETGRPFMGSAGKRLDAALLDAGISRGEVFITNIVKCRPPHNRRPKKIEADSCKSYLDRQIRALNPSLIVLLGDTALKRFFPRMRLASSHGRVLLKRGRRFLPTYHPAAVIYDRSLQRILFKDFRGIRMLLRG